MSAYRVCPGCGYDSCICPEGSYDHGQTRPLKIKLSTTKSPSRPAAAYTGPAAAGISKHQVKKRGPPPKPGRFTLPHSQAHAAYDQRARNPSAKIKKFNPAKTFKNGATRRASAQRKGGRGSYRPTDDDLYGSDHFPTFVSAESSSSDDEDDEEEDAPPAQCVAEVTDVTSPAGKGRVPAAQGEEESSDDGSDESSELTDPDDISVQLSEERFIIAEERARVKRELLGNDDTGGSYKKRFDWQASPSKRSSQTSSGSLTDSDSGSESSSEDELEQAADGDDEEPAEDDADVTMRAVSTPLPERDDSSSEEDDFDAAVFFANLDSENEDGHESDVDDDTTSIASELDQPPPAENHFHIPIVSQDMHGLLVFGDPLAMNDVGIDIPGFPSSTSISASIPTAHDADATDSDDGYMMDVDTDQGATEDEDDASTLGMETDDGETTDDMDEDELVQILAPRFSTPPPQSVDPLALICSPTTAMPVPTPFASNATATPRLRNTFRRRRDTTMSDPSFSTSGSSLSPPPAIVRGPKLPTMGRFENPSVASPSSPADPTVKVVVIDGTTKNIPSPFTRRLRRDLLQLRAKRLSKNRRYLSTSPLMSAGENSDNSLPSFAGTSSQTFIDLSDVLDCAIFEDEEEELEESIVPESPAIPEPPISPSESDAPVPSGSLTRWDRVPMNTFRRTRSDAVMDLGSPFDMNLPLPGLPLSPTFAYNKVLKSPGAHSAKWWDPKSTLATPTSRRDKRRHPSASIQAVLALSPMLFPSDYGGGQGSSSPPRGSQYHSSPHKIHRDKERRARKTKTVDSAAVKPQKRQSHIQRRSSLQAVPSLRL